MNRIFIGNRTLENRSMYVNRDLLVIVAYQFYSVLRQVIFFVSGRLQFAKSEIRDPAEAHPGPDFIKLN